MKSYAPLVPAVLAALVLGVTPALGQASPPDDMRDTRCVLRVRGMERAIVRDNLTYRTAADSVRGFDLFLPEGTTPKQRVPVVVFFNAGSGMDPPQRKWGIYRDWARLVTTRGMAAMLPDAARGNARTEMGAALAHLRAEATTFGLDSGRVAIWACSMHVPAASRFAADPIQGIDAVALCYGVADTAAIDPDKPAFLARAGLDDARIYAAMGAWATKAIRLGAPLTWIDLPSLHHAFDAYEDDALSRSTVAATLDFLERELSPAGLEARTSNAEERRVTRFIYAGDWPGALRAAEAWLVVSPESGKASLSVADACYQTKDFTRAAKLYERAAQKGVQPGTSWYNAACCHALTGDRERALELLEKVTGIPGVDHSGWLRDPDLASLRDDPRFQRLVAK
jgi:hypothetical protein